MPATAIIAGLLLLAGSSKPAPLVQTGDRFAGSAQVAPPGYLFEVGFSFSEGLNTQTVEVFSAADHDAPNDMVRFPRIFSARVSGLPDGRVGWTDSRKCPALYGVLELVLHQPPARFTLPNLYGVPPEGASIAAIIANEPEGGGATIWGRARQPSGQWATMIIESHGGEIELLADTAKKALSGCWVYDS